MKKKTFVIFIISLIICIDQLIKVNITENLYNDCKVLINGLINLTYVENTGGAFGIGDSNIWIVIILNIILIGLMVIYLFINIKKINTYTIISLALIISGGIGNLIDRIFKGHVIDYIDINPLFKYPIFNFADICVVMGITIFCITQIFSNYRRDKWKNIR